ncbi:cysteine hydrolase family protein [Parendozoicomonas haliclonae]|uniref:Isochorismatase family protein YecD n=1 Tax=Parendozoicomonas haliclonae TaxID=1960125 RepID=A0A1X7AEU6_9GAMM|nr:cysteine hydrolase [Parendozoicomonas haliclonae]SMA34392.1 Isochorismatase family protein YecD [Parendozoicomonas haliclonae]
MKTALLILDLMNDIIHPDSPIATSATCALENNVVGKANAITDLFRRRGHPVIFVRVGFSANYSECSQKHWSLFARAMEYKGYRLGTWGTEYHPDLEIKEGDIHLIKHRISPFYATGLEAVLRGHSIQRLVMLGVSTDFVIQSCAREAHDRDYEAVIVGDACAAATPETHEHALESLGHLVSVQSSRQFLGA